MTSPRRERLAHELRSEISKLLLRDIRDPRVGFVTLTRAEVSPDLTHSRIYFTVFGTDAARQQTLKALNRAAGYLQRAIFRELRLRRNLEIVFVLDEAAATGNRIDELLEQLHGAGGGEEGEEE
jgi:ribosome-binding factor A